MSIYLLEVNLLLQMRGGKRSEHEVVLSRIRCFLLLLEV